MREPASQVDSQTGKGTRRIAETLAMEKLAPDHQSILARRSRMGRKLGILARSPARTPMSQDSEAQRLLDRLAEGEGQGDRPARERLIALAQDRFAALARAMLRRYPHVRRWAQTDDLLNAALLRLDRSLAEVRPGSLGHFDNLAAAQIRRELIDLARKVRGPEGVGAHHHTDPDGRLDQVAASSARPETLEEWTAFHEAVARLPDEERQVVDLLWYRGLTHAQAAEALGVATKTVQRRWASARLLLQDALADDPPATE
jgi:RNA polymerase sigma-70 factor (ECF subfamily)